MTVTEIALLTTPEGCTLDDPASEAGKIWQTTINTVKSRKGFQRCFWGRKIEDPKILIWIIEWDSIEDHAAFINDPIYKEFFTTMAPILDMSTPPVLYHVHSTTGPPAATPLSAPTTELAAFYLPASISAAEKKAFEENFAKLGGICSSTTDEPASSVSSGWAVEEFDEPEGKAIKYGLLLGWESMEAHIEVTKTQPFKDAFGPVVEALLRADPPSLDMAHVKLQKA